MVLNKFSPSHNPHFALWELSIYWISLKGGCLARKTYKNKDSWWRLKHDLQIISSFYISQNITTKYCVFDIFKKVRRLFIFIGSDYVLHLFTVRVAVLRITDCSYSSMRWLRRFQRIAKRYLTMMAHCPFSLIYVRCGLASRLMNLRN